MKALLRAARDPAWQMIGVVVAVLLAFFASSASEKGRSELSVVHHARSDLSRQLLPEAKFRFLHEDSAYDINRSILDYYVITNESSRPIEPNDFFAPITVELDSSHLKLVAVENCSASAAQACSVDSRPQGGSYIPFGWAKANEKWQARPLLINPGEKSCVIVVSERLGPDQSAIAEQRPVWSSRVRGITLVQYDSVQAYVETLPRSLSDYFHVIVYMDTVGILWFVFLFASLFFSYIQLARISGWLPADAILSQVKVVALGLVSITTSEILVDVFVNGNSGDRLHPVVWPLLAVAVIFFGVLSASALKASRSRQEG